MYSTCWPETMFWRQRKMNFENIFILPNVVGNRSRRRFGGIFIKVLKVNFARSSLLYIGFIDCDETSPFKMEEMRMHLFVLTG